MSADEREWPETATAEQGGQDEAQADTRARGPTAEPRLSSLKSPRDLSLTLTALRKPQNKKTFAPNLKVVRNKNKSAAFEGTEDRRDRRKTGDRRTHPQRPDRKTRDRDSGGVVKSGGVFSEGVAAVPKASGGTGHSDFRKSAGDAPVSQRSRITPKTEKRTIEHSRDADLKDILKEEGDEDRLDSAFCPTRLPIVSDDENSPRKLECEVRLFSECDAEVKTESGRGDSARLFGPGSAPTPILMQFPDALPGRTTGDASDENEDRTDESNDVRGLRNAEEGRIGKIVTYESGKIKLHIGNARYDVTLGTRPRFRQDVVSVSTNSEERNGDAVELGSVRNKLIVIPDWKSLFREAEKCSQ